ncbi:TonB-dependent receptor [Alteromonas oceanisediminis]|uniref:TonB-dependent receptor n=1 Tax=Alteromonas oceanisediminis TaxID=2836180 RepID=UPI001BDA05D3|nr:TonB-dependent receptor [Alteromonas oceanisediminis]MBT0585590.1 TonB-dependent receptor [Alteromonas oceanisediminis]
MNNIFKLKKVALAASFAPMVFALPGAAQDASGSSNEPPEASSTVERIIVTAQRREENLQEVPVSVAVLTAKEIREQDISDVSRLEQVIPGLRLNRTGAAQRPAIRGVYTEAIGLNSDPRIGFYIDEIYQARPQQATAALVDLARVEVQKGPQGTLFGRNSYGGNISLTTAPPTEYFEAGFDVTLGNYNRTRAEGFVNLPVNSDLALRFAGATERRDGFLESIVTDDADLQDKEEDYIRGAVRWVPSSFNDDLEVLVRGSYFKRGGAGFNVANGKVIGVAIDPNLITPPGGSVVFNGVTANFFGTAPGLGGFNGLNVGTGTLYPFSNALRDGIPDVNGADVGIPVPGPYESIYDAVPYEDLEQTQYSAVVNYDISQSLRFRSITSYTDFDTTAGGDGDGTPLPLRYFAGGTQSEVFTQEFQLQSTNSDSPLQYTVGAFYLEEEGRDGTSFYYLNRNYSTETAESLGLPVYFGAGGGLGGSANGCQFSFTTPADCNVDFTTGNLFDFLSLAEAKTKSFAVYAQGTYDLSDTLALTLGVRYTKDDKEYKTITQSPSNGTLFAGQYAEQQGFTDPQNYYAVNPFFTYDFNPTCGGFTSQGISTDQSDQPVAEVPNYFYTLCGERTFDFFTYRIALDYQVTKDNMVYASFNTGRHSGGFGAGLTAANSPGLITTFDSEGVKAFEVGSKNEFLDGKLRVNAAAFFNKYTDLQEQGTQIVTVDGQARNVSTIFNVGEQDTPGAEVSFTAVPAEGLKVSGSLTYLRARYDEFPRYNPANFSCFYYSMEPGCGSGAFPPTAPQNYGVGGGYFPNAVTNPEDFIETGIDGFNFAYIPTDLRVQNTPDWQGNISVAYEMDFGQYGTVTPQFNTHWTGSYLLSPSAPNIEQDSYFKTDLRVIWESEDRAWSAQAFVQNLENEATLGRITVRSNGEIQGTYSDPRTYGIRVSYRYY